MANLTQRQQALLEDVSAMVATASSSSSSSKPVKEEDFYRFFQKMERQYEEETESLAYLTNWGWIFHHQQLCHEVCDSLALAFEKLEQVEHFRREVSHKCDVLHHQCEHLLKEQHVLEEYTKSISERLEKFDRVVDLQRILDRGPHSAPTDEFERCLDALDDGIAFLERHPEYYDSKQYLRDYDQMRRRACQMLKTQVCRNLERTLEQVLEQVESAAGGKSGYETSVFYVRFRAAATHMKPLAQQLYRRRDGADIYGQALDELENFFVQMRIRLVSGPLQQHMQNVMVNFQEDPSACIRQISTYVLKLCILEKQTFLAYFDARHPQDSLDGLIKHFGTLLYDLIRPLILSFDDIDVLREIADALQLDILQPHQSDVASGKSEHDLVALLGIVLRLYRDVQERLIFRVQMYIRDEIKGFVLQDERQLSYPAMLFRNFDKPNETLADMEYYLAKGSSKGNFVTLERTLLVLSKIFRVLEISTFQGLAQESVDACIGTLKYYSTKIKSNMDGQLFLIKHLLVLREQVVSFECDLVCKEKFFDFAAIYGNVKDAFAEIRTPSSKDTISSSLASTVSRAANDRGVLRVSGKLFRILTPKLTETRIDSKKDMETELRNACEVLIQEQIQSIALPLVEFNARVTEEMGSYGTETREQVAAAKSKSFLQPAALEKLNADFLQSVTSKVPLLCAKMRIYLTNRFEANEDGFDSHAASQNFSTFHVLFRPIHVSLVESVAQLWSLFREFEIQHSFISKQALDDQISDMVGRLENMEYGEILKQFFAEEVK
ncbi:unnamed protein product [Amoebophrya sp. A120]|nr:unnamed protein product [Amoebophrya sp. A120]|eukprot:GSA120T00024061001.1